MQGSSSVHDSCSYQPLPPDLNEQAKKANKNKFDQFKLAFFSEDQFKPKIIHSECFTFQSIKTEDQALIYYHKNNHQVIEVRSFQGKPDTQKRFQLIRSSNKSRPPLERKKVSIFKSIYDKALFLYSNHMYLFITRNGHLMKWNSDFDKFYELNVKLPDKIEHPLLDGFKKKLYFFTPECQLYSLDLKTCFIKQSSSKASKSSSQRPEQQSAGNAVSLNSEILQLGAKQVDLQTKTPTLIENFDCKIICNATLLKDCQTHIIFQDQTDSLFCLDLKTGNLRKIKKAKKFFKSSIPYSVVIWNEGSLQILSFEAGLKSQKIILRSQSLKESQPISFSKNSSGPFHAISFDNGWICLIRQGTWTEECIIEKPKDQEFRRRDPHLQHAQSREHLNQDSNTSEHSEDSSYPQYEEHYDELQFSHCEDFLLARDSKDQLSKFLIRENLKDISEFNLQEIEKMQEQSKEEQKSPSNQIMVINSRSSSGLSENESDFSHQLQAPKPRRKLSFKIQSQEFKVFLDGFNTLKKLTEFYWKQMECFVGVFREVILFIKEVADHKFNLIGHFVLGETIQKAQTIGNYLKIESKGNSKYAFEFMKQELEIAATHQFPCTFRLYEPPKARVVMTTGIESKIPFFPKIFLTHAFQREHDPYSPVLFWYKQLNYGPPNPSNLERYLGNEHLVSNNQYYTILHLFAKEGRDDLIEAALKRNPPLLMDSKGRSPLSLSIEIKSLKSEHLLLAYIAEVEQDPVYNKAYIITKILDQLPE